MSILDHKKTKVICQGFPEEWYLPLRTSDCHGTRMTGGVSPGKVASIGVFLFSIRSRSQGLAGADATVSMSAPGRAAIIKAMKPRLS